MGKLSMMLVSHRGKDTAMKGNELKGSVPVALFCHCQRQLGKEHARLRTAFATSYNLPLFQCSKPI